MVGWHHRLNGHEFEQAPGVGNGQGGLVCCSPWGHKESDTTERLNNSKVALAVKSLPTNTGDSRHAGWIPGWERLPGVANATHFSVVAWEISWTEEPGRLQSMGPQGLATPKYSTAYNVK